MNLPTSTASFTGFPLVIPTQTQHPTAQLVLRNNLGQVVQQWLVRQNKCTLGNAASCSLRCELPGIAPYHALLVIGARQVFIRALAPKLTRDGRQFNEILLTEEKSHFEIAGHRFELSRSTETLASAGPKESNTSERLKFTLARPFELSNRKKHAIPMQSAAAQSVVSTIENQSTTDSAWLAQMIQAAVQPLECQLHNLLQPLSELQSEARKQKRSRKNRNAARKQESAEDTTAAEAAQRDADAREAKEVKLNQQVEEIVGKQSAAIDVLTERISDVHSQLSVIERIISDERDAVAVESRETGFAEKAQLDLQSEAIGQLQSGVVAVSSAIQRLQGQQNDQRQSDQVWRDGLQVQLGSLTQVVDGLFSSVSELHIKATQIADTTARAESAQEQWFSAEVTPQPEAQISVPAPKYLQPEAPRNAAPRDAAPRDHFVTASSEHPIQPISESPDAIIEIAALEQELGFAESTTHNTLPRFDSHRSDWGDAFEDAQHVHGSHFAAEDHNAAEGHNAGGSTRSDADEFLFGGDAIDSSNELLSDLPAADINTSWNSRAWNDEPADSSAQGWPAQDSLAQDWAADDELDLATSDDSSPSVSSKLPSWWVNDDSSDDHVQNYADDRIETPAATGAIDAELSYGLAGFPSDPEAAAVFNQLMQAPTNQPLDVPDTPCIDTEAALGYSEPLVASPSETVEENLSELFGLGYQEADDEANLPAAALQQSGQAEEQVYVDAIPLQIDFETPSSTQVGQSEVIAADEFQSADAEVNFEVHPGIDTTEDVLEEMALEDSAEELTGDYAALPELEAELPASEIPELGPQGSVAEGSVAEDSVEDDSVEDYMRKLLARMRGVPEEEVEVPKAKPAPAPTQSAMAAKTATASSVAAAMNSNQPRITASVSAEVTEPFDPEKYMPRALAPEHSSGMAAMRELANSSARTAIHKSTRQRHVSGVALKAAIAVIGFAVGAVLIAINGFNLNIGLVATFASFLVGGIWGYDAISSLKPLLKAGLVLKPQSPRTPSPNAPLPPSTPADRSKPSE